MCIWAHLYQQLLSVGWEKLRRTPSSTGVLVGRMENIPRIWMVPR